MPYGANRLTVMHLLVKFSQVIYLIYFLPSFVRSLSFFILQSNFSYFKRWINLKKAFCKWKGYFAKSLTVMLRDLELNHVVCLLNVASLYLRNFSMFQVVYKSVLTFSLLLTFFLDWIRLYYHSKVIQQSHLPTSCLYRFTSRHRGKLIFFLQGRLHSGIDDVRNMCQITRCLAKSGHVFQNTSIYVDEKHDFENL